MVQNQCIAHFPSLPGPAAGKERKKEDDMCGSEAKGRARGEEGEDDMGGLIDPCSLEARGAGYR